MGHLEIPDETAIFRPRSGRITIKLFGYKGVVVDQRTWSETETYSRTRLYATAVGGRAGVVAGPEIESRVTEKLELFLCDGNQEEAFRLHNVGLPVRTGHEVALVWAVPSGKKQGTYVWARNCTTKETIEVPLTDDFILSAEYFAPRFVQLLHIPLFGAAFVSLILSLALASNRGGGYVVFVALIIWALTAWRVFSFLAMKKIFRERLSQRLQAIGMLVDSAVVISKQPTTAAAMTTGE